MTCKVVLCFVSWFYGFIEFTKSRSKSFKLINKVFIKFYKTNLINMTWSFAKRPKPLLYNWTDQILFLSLSNKINIFEFKFLK